MQEAKRELSELEQRTVSIKRTADEALKTDDLDLLIALSEEKSSLDERIKKVRKRINAQNAIKDAMERRYASDEYVPLNLIQDAAVTLEITDVLKLAGVAQVGSNTDERSSALFAKILYEDSFWKAKFKEPFPGLYILSRASVPTWVTIQESERYANASRWRKYYLTIRYLYRTQVYPWILRIAKYRSRNQNLVLIDTKILPEKTNLIEFTFKVVNLDKTKKIQRTIQEIAYRFLFNSEGDREPYTFYSFLDALKRQTMHDGKFVRENFKTMIYTPYVFVTMMGEFCVWLYKELSSANENVGAMLLAHTNDTSINEMISYLRFGVKEEKDREYKEFMNRRPEKTFLSEHPVTKIGMCIACKAPAKYECKLTGELFCSKECADK